MFSTAAICGDSLMSNQENTPETVLNPKDLTPSLYAESPHFLVGRAYLKF